MQKLIVLLFLLASVSIHSQCGTNSGDPICRSSLAAAMFEYVYEDNLDIWDYDAAYFPNPFLDLQGNSELDIKIKILSYLKYDDGLTVFSYAHQQNSSFYPEAYITRIETLIYIMEAWNIPPDYSGSSPYNDVPTNSVFFGYVNKAFDEGIIGGGSNFNPFDLLTFSETIDWILNVLGTSYHPINEDLEDIHNYFVPGIYNPYNLGNLKGLNQGVFNHYAKNSFVIPDRKLNLNFSHFYSSSMIELPEGFFPIKPLGRGWSHNYNSYIMREENVGSSNDDLFYIVWPDGTIQIYNDSENEYITKGVFDDFDNFGTDEVTITKKNNVEYYFENLDDERNILYLRTITDHNGNEIFIKYENAEENDTKRIEYVEAPSGKRLYFYYYNNTDYLEEIHDPLGRTIQFTMNEYDSYRLDKFYDAKGNDTEYIYNSVTSNLPLSERYKVFILEEIKLPEGNRIRAEYDIENKKLNEYQFDDDDAIEIELDYNYEDDELNAQVSSTLPSGGNFVKNYTYNENGLITDYNSDTESVNITYPSNGINVMLPSSTNYNGLDIDYEYEDGNVTKIDIEGVIIEEFEYEDNDLTEHTDPNGNVTTFNYINHNLTKIIDANTNETNITYDQYGQVDIVTNQEDIQINYDYDGIDGALNKISAPEGIEIIYGYDLVNRIDSISNNGLTSFYEFDDNDNLKSFIDSGNVTTLYDYDRNDNLDKITLGNDNQSEINFTYDDQDRVEIENFEGLVKVYDYTDEGYLNWIRKPSDDVINYDYDNKGRLEENGTITDINYTSRNLIRDITNNTGTIHFTYNPKTNRVDDVETVHGFDLNYDWKDGGQIKEITYPTFNGNDVEVSYSYNSKNLVSFVYLEANGNTTLLAEFEYYKDDRLKKIDLSNQTSVDYYYDDAGRLKGIEHTNEVTGAVIYVSNLLLNNRGNIESQTESFQPIVPGNETVLENELIDYQYDDTNQITIAGTDNYDVDEDGNTIQIGSEASINYDIDDRLTNYQDFQINLSFKYNPFNQRVEENRDGVVTKYVRDVMNDNLIVELDNSNNPLNYYIYSPTGMLIARMKPNGDLFYYHGDIRGSVIAMTNANAEITHQYRYSDFGEILNFFEPANDFNPFRYVGVYGVEYDLADLYYMRARYYKPSIGRFLTQDPIWSTNLYLYANNNPIKNIDPSGQISIKTIFDLSSKFVDGIGVGGNFSAIAGGGYTGGVSFDFILSGKHASYCPLVNGSFGLGTGIEIGPSANISVAKKIGGNDISPSDYEGKNNYLSSSAGSINYSSADDGGSVFSASISTPSELGVSAGAIKSKNLLNISQFSHICGFVLNQIKF
ncbi:RHS repeat-associated core domain-containing protein [Bizionia paragorgiae]|uniref:RHS repeat-associated core domain-containing protein n=1 Tax=Bizionia paragorgiae TaxID=283786 RepID=UPI003A9271D8